MVEVTIADTLAFLTRAWPVSLERRAAQTFEIGEDHVQVIGLKDLAVILADARRAMEALPKGPFTSPAEDALAKKEVPDRPI